MNIVLKTIRVQEVSFKINNLKMPANVKFDLKPTFSRRCRNAVENEKINFVDLQIKIESSPDEPKPFDLLLSVTGLFEADLADENEKALFSLQATQILFPYLKTMVAQLTLVTNEAPILLPELKDGILFPEDQKIKKVNDDLIN